MRIESTDIEAGRGYAVTIKTDLWNSGCLPPLLRKEIEQAERRRIVLHDLMGTEEWDNLKNYIDQLKNVLAAIEAARQA